MEILYYFLFIFFGTLIGMILGRWLVKEKVYGGSIIVKKESGKIVYTLVLRNDPEQLQFMDRVLFKVIQSETDSDGNLISQVKHRL